MSEKKTGRSSHLNLRSSASCLASAADESAAATGGKQLSARSEKRISSAAVRDLCGGVSDMTLWRWLDNPNLNFPKFCVIARRRYWKEADILAWLDDQTAKAAG